jgi:hypothetical protein
MDIYPLPLWITCAATLPANAYRDTHTLNKDLAMTLEDAADAPLLGRPPKPAEEARSRRTVTFLTESEHSKLVEIARRNNLSVSALAHKFLSQSISTWHD